MVLTVLQILADWPASLTKNIFQSHKLFFVVVQIFLVPTGSLTFTLLVSKKSNSKIVNL